MAWREKISQGSFRGVPFQTAESEVEIGRRVALHEYAGRDDPYPEDTGKKGRQFSFDCHVAGADYMAQRDALIAAFEQYGPGKLVHKFLGELQVQVLTVRVRESNSELGMARFAVTVVESGKNEFPNNSVSTATVVNQRANTATSALVNDFSQSFSVAGKPQFVTDEAKSIIDSGMDAVAGMGVSMPVANVSHLMHSPADLATTITGAIGQVAEVADLRALRAFGHELPAVKTTTVTRVAQAQNQEALLRLINTSSVIEMARRMVDA